MKNKNFLKECQSVIKWIDEYRQNLEQLPVKPSIQFGEILAKFNKKPPLRGRSLSSILKEFDKKIMPGMTHWQHPHFHAFFPANTSDPSLFAEFIISTIAAQCMLWDTSPAATELEILVLQWLVSILGLPKHWEGSIQDTASSSVLVALAVAREVCTDFQVNNLGFYQQKTLRVYISSETNISVLKSAKLVGFGSENVIQIPILSSGEMRADKLKEQIISDLEMGFLPCAVVATIGTTGLLAVDPIKEISEICHQYKIWLHIDAAYLGSALLLNKYKSWLKNVKKIDSFCFNPHKWLFVHFDCSVLWFNDKNLLLKALKINQEILYSNQNEEIVNFKDWGIQLGRRFRALKLWFVFNYFGTNTLQKMLLKQLELTHYFVEKLKTQSRFILILPQRYNVVIIQFQPQGVKTNTEINKINLALVEKINSSGKMYVTKTNFAEKIVIRIVFGHSQLSKKHIDQTWRWLNEMANTLR